MINPLHKVGPGDTVVLTNDTAGVKTTVTFEVSRVHTSHGGDISFYAKGGSKLQGFLMHASIDDAWDPPRWFLKEHIQEPVKEPVNTWAVVKMTTPFGDERFYVKTPNGRWMGISTGMLYEWEKLYNIALERDTIEVIRD